MSDGLTTYLNKNHNFIENVNLKGIKSLYVFRETEGLSVYCLCRVFVCLCVIREVTENEFGTKDMTE